jgi:peptide deformylase
MGSQELATPSLDVVDFLDPELPLIIADLHDTMIEKGGVGIAAPQIGINLRIVIFGFEKNERYPNAEPVPLTILINPIIEYLGNDMEDGWEGCLSVPGLRGLVPRYESIKYSGYNENGIQFNKTVSGFHARVVQHEYDHLDGILYPQRIKDMRSFGFEDELNINSEK